MRLSKPARRIKPHSSMAVRHFGSVSVSISVPKCVTPLKTAQVIDPAHSSSMTPENLSLPGKAESRSAGPSKLSWPIGGVPTGPCRADASRAVLWPTHRLRPPPSWNFGQSRGRADENRQRRDQRHRLHRSVTVWPCASMSRFIRATIGLFAPFRPVDQLPAVALAEGPGTLARPSLHR